MNRNTFLVLYLALFLLTYVIRYIVLFLDGTVGYSFDLFDLSNAYIGHAEGILLIIYAAMAYLCFKRGEENRRNYLVAFPIIGGFFDVFLVLFIFVPTVMNILGLILGVAETQADKPVQKNPAEGVSRHA